MPETLLFAQPLYSVASTAGAGLPKFSHPQTRTKMKSKPIFRLSLIAFAYAGSAHAADIAFSTDTTLNLNDTQSYDNGTINRVGGGTGTHVIFDSGANYTFSGNLTLTGAWNRVTLNTGASLTVNGTLSADVSGVSLNGGTLTAGALRLGDNPNWAGAMADGKQTVEWGDSVINGSTIIANQSNGNFFSLNNDSGFASNNLWINGDGVTIDSAGFDIGNTMSTFGSGGLTKTGSGTLSLAASNNFTGNTLVSNGVLEVTTTGKLYGGGYTLSPTITVETGAILRLNGWSWDAAGSIANLDYGRNRLVVNGGTIEYTGASNLNPGDPGSASRNLTVGTGGATLRASSSAGQTWTISAANGNLLNDNGLTLDGAGAGEIQKVIEGTGGVTKSGAGTWTLSGANTYLGATTVSSGTLSLTWPSLDNESSVVIESGATLNLNFSGNDIIGSLEIDGSGPLAPGVYDASHPTYGSSFTGTGALLVVTGASGSWTSLTDGDWEEPSNWDSSTIATEFNQTATFSQVTGAIVTLTGNQTIGNLIFDTSDYTLTGSNILTLDASIMPTVSVGSGRTATISARIDGFIGMEKTGAGALVLTASNIISGETLVSEGTLQLGGGPLSNPEFGVLENASLLTIEAGATVQAMGANAFKGYSGGSMDVNLNGGTLTLNDGVTQGGNHILGFITLNGTISGVGDAFYGGFNLSGNVDVIENSTISATNTNTLGGTRTVTVSAGKTLDWSGNITNFTPTNGPSSFIFEGSGTTVLSGVNTHTGSTTINDGELVLADDGQLTFAVTDSSQTIVGGTGTATFNGDFNINTSAVTGTTGGIWLLVDRANLSGESFGSTFNVIGFTPQGDGVTWTMSDAKGDWSFSEDTGELTLDVGSDYDDWVAANGVVGTETDDDDNDGLSNADEYAFGLDPTGGSSVNPIAVPLDNATGTFSYTRRDQSLTSLSYSVWYSTDLGSWTEDTGAVEGTPVLSGEVETVPVTISNSLLSNSKLFIQVRAE